MGKMKKKVPANPMLLEERRQHILSVIRQEGRVLVSEISDELDISRITIRKDLDELESKGLVQRTHGGALAPQKGALLDPSLEEKQSQQFKEKRRIAEAAVALVKEEQCVLLDSGSTTTAVARALRAFSRLTIVTNAVNIAGELADTNFEVILTGGTLRRNSFSLVGPLAEDVLKEIHADILFLGVDGFDAKLGLTTPNFLESRVNRSMIKAARRVVAVCDSTKFSRRSLAIIAPPSAVHTVITDTMLSKEDEETLRNAGIELILV
jgi:DeoR family transcriptional regulator of aga operon